MKEIFKKIFSIILGIVGGFGLVSYLEHKYRRCYFCGELINDKKERK